jgi:hypothetical protein
MFYYNGEDNPIQIFNKRARNYSMGGYIKPDPRNRFPNEDSIASVLEAGSLVIPVKVMESGVMDGYKGKLTDKKITDSDKLTPVVLMEKEMVVAKKYAPAVERYLKKHGWTLPLDS